MPQIYYLPDERLIEVDEGATILEASLQAEIPHTHVCGGSARCSTCRVLIVEGLENCGDRFPPEQAISDRLHLDPTIRLGCQTQVFGDIKLRRLAIDADDLELINDEMAGKVQPESVGQEKHIAILFADIRGFTPFAEKLLPYDAIYVLNRYFRLMGQVISRYDGTINNYIGDGLIALFGVDDPDRSAEKAVRAGLEMLEAMEKLNPYLETLYHNRLQIGIGIHYGWVVIGEVGTPDNKKFTAIGDAVNLASRIETANKQVGTNLLISEATYEQVKDQVIGSRSVEVQLPGKSGEYRLYEILEMSAYSLPEQMNSNPKNTSLIQTLVTKLKQLFDLLWKGFSKMFGRKK